jgi:hypothetical protein
MKHFLAKLVLISAFLSLKLYCVAPFISPRSQSEDSARELAGWAHQVNLYDQDCIYGSLAFTLEYTRSFRPHKIAECLFGDDLINAKNPFIRITGSQVGDRDETDWLADYFGLPTDFQSTISFNPRNENIIFDINFYLGLDNWLEGLYFRIHAPICYTRWDLDFCEKIIDPGINNYRPGYFNETQNGVPRGQLLQSFTDYVSRGRVPNLGDLVIFDSLQHARMANRRLSKTRLSDVQAAFGWNFFLADDHHFGLNVRMAAPTGNRPHAQYIFEPIAGNSHHWELGVGVTAHYLLWVNECYNSSIGFYIDGNVTHMFGSRQRRTFDLVNKPMSRYMLTERLGVPVTNLFSNGENQGMAAGATAPSSQFQNVFVPLANLTTLDVNVSIGAQVDITAMVDYAYKNINVDVGYNYWARTCEKIKFINACSIPFNGSSNKGLYALKGDAQVYGFVASDAMPPLPDSLVAGVSPIALSATENLADIHMGTNTPIGTPFNNSQIQNPNVDNPGFAFFDIMNDTHQIVIAPNTPGGDTTQQRTSNEPIFIKVSDIDLEGAETKGTSNKFFGHISYIWEPCNGWIPYLGVGGFIEFAHQEEKECRNQADDDSCQSCSFSQWGLWLKGGVSF